MRHFLEIDDLETQELELVLKLSAATNPPKVLADQGVALLFEKPSGRTRNSMEMAVVQLGGHPMYIQPEELGIGSRETAEDVVRVMAGYHTVLAARVFDHGLLEQMAATNSVPIVNLLSDIAHPMQALADLLTIEQEIGLGKVGKVAYVGDANNVWRSLAIGCSMLGIQTSVASPAGHGPNSPDLERVLIAGGSVQVTDDPSEAVEGADVVYTDVWTSMGQEDEKSQRLDAFSRYTVNSDLMAETNSNSIFMHCLPAHRGEEVTDEVIESPRSKVFLQAQNRMHSARGLLSWIVGEVAKHG
ncbi:MAG: ornithine carbamoyltransferase [Acidimicrobiales bacterium]|nr:ornithine carbamoyltransferase [Acidimicrobiales bacterium]RPH18061.1 MAG: ornithine carbamoyltransferase [Actinobacteria bacterium TMED270]|tara:strand:- start:4903 stop:5805 length:903 start_codon:yes stop_codon:yes gene_type:complete